VYVGLALLAGLEVLHYKGLYVMGLSERLVVGIRKLAGIRCEAVIPESVKIVQFHGLCPTDYSCGPLLWTDGEPKSIFAMQYRDWRQKPLFDS
jgi:hypothetical protein